MWRVRLRPPAPRSAPGLRDPWPGLLERLPQTLRSRLAAGWGGLSLGRAGEARALSMSSRRLRTRPLQREVLASSQRPLHGCGGSERRSRWAIGAAGSQPPCAGLTSGLNFIWTFTSGCVPSHETRPGACNWGLWPTALKRRTGGLLGGGPSPPVSAAAPSEGGISVSEPHSGAHPSSDVPDVPGGLGSPPTFLSDHPCGSGLHWPPSPMGQAAVCTALLCRKPPRLRPLRTRPPLAAQAPMSPQLFPRPPSRRGPAGRWPVEFTQISSPCAGGAGLVLQPGTAGTKRPDPSLN